MFGLIPLPIKIAAAILIVLGIFGYGYIKGNAHGKSELVAYAAKKEKQIAALEKKNAEIADNVVTKFVDRTNTIREKEYVYRDLAAKNVPAQSDLSNGWVYTHDISATSGDADPARSFDASSSGIKDNQALLTVISNYAICQRNQIQLIELQRWITENKAAIDKMDEVEKKKK
jgi:hypothetical protein